MTTQMWVFVGYFAVVFALGWYALRATRNEKDYWIAGGELGWSQAAPPWQQRTHLLGRS